MPAFQSDVLGAAEGLGVLVLGRTVVRGEYDDGVFGHPGILQCFHHLPDAPVELLHDVSPHTVLGGTGELLARLERSVRIVVGIVEKERLPGILLDDPGHPLGIELGQARQRCLGEDLFAIVEEAGRVGEIAGHAVVVVEALLPGQELRLRAEMPLTHHEGLVARLPALLGYCDFIRVQTEEPVGLSVGIDAHVKARPLRIATSQEGRPGRRTNGGRGMEVGESNAFLGQPVQVRGLDLGGAIAGDVRVTEIIRQEEYDVGLFLTQAGGCA